MASKRAVTRAGASRATRTAPKAPAAAAKIRRPSPCRNPNQEALAGLPKRRRHEKTPGSGSDFQKGQNSHTGTVFQRGRDQIPRGNGNLMLRIIYNDKRQRFYDQICALTV